VDEFKGRIVPDRRWPAGLHNAIEAKEGVAAKAQGKILGSITIQNLIALYPQVCGMTGTAATQAEEFRTIYELDVEVIATNRPVIRVDLPDEKGEGAGSPCRNSSRTRVWTASANRDSKRGGI
jgi:preprotein translocase subunit SecA